MFQSQEQADALQKSGRRSKGKAMSNGNCNEPWPLSLRMTGGAVEGKSGADRRQGGERGNESDLEGMPKSHYEKRNVSR